MLFFRMFVVMGITLFTARVLLKELGIDDYGIYGVIGGIVTLTSFLDTAMTAASQRYFSLYLGKNDPDAVSTYFIHTIFIQIIFSIIIIILCETLGIWFVKYKLNYDVNREAAILIMFQFTILTFILNLLKTPFNALIISLEKMQFFAYISIADAFLKLLGVYIITYVQYDKLITYSVLILINTLLIFMIYVYVINRENIIKYKFQLSREKLKELFSFIGWNLFGGLASVGLYQVSNIFINLFFGPSVNAARSVSIQVKSAVSNFSTNIRTATNPQIVKYFAEGNIGGMTNLLNITIKTSFLLILLISTPLLLETDFILKLWLKTVPEYTTVFCQLFIINNLIDSISAPLVTPIQATGKIKLYQIFSGILLLLNIPLTYLFFLWEFDASSAIIVNIVISIIVIYVRLFYLKQLIQEFSIKNYFIEIILKSVVLFSVTLGIMYLLIQTIMPGFFRLFLEVFIGSIIIMISTYLVYLNGSEKLKIKILIKNYIKKVR